MYNNSFIQALTTHGVRMYVHTCMHEAGRAYLYNIPLSHMGKPVDNLNINIGYWPPPVSLKVFHIEDLVQA